ncbi:MAG: glycosyltransferase family 9 protein [Desulfatibacillum sp.]|nr:glycosyltransferase family 9 protein [Desulfatibacillum sp.]
MNVDLMRKIDRYAGIPLCFAMTLLTKGLRAVWPARRKPVKNVLFVELSEMGSVILADPAIKKARDVLKAQVYFAIFQRNQKSLEILNTIPGENVFGIRSGSFWELTVDCLRFLAWTRKKNIDTVIDLELFSRVTALLCGMCGADKIVGYHAFHTEGLYRGDMITHRTAYNPHIHISKNFIALVNALKTANPEEVPFSKTLIKDEEIRLDKVVPKSEALDFMRRKIADLHEGYAPETHRLVLVNPNAGELLPQRRWMPENFVAVMKMVLEAHEDVLVLITGDPSEQTEADDLKARVNSDRCVNFAGQCQLTELPVLYSLSTLMLTNDSGPAHFAAVTSMPTYVIFGPETPALYGSLGNCIPIFAGLACSPCVSAANHRKTPCTDNVCLKVITPELVFGLLGQTLEGGIQTGS